MGTENTALDALAQEKIDADADFQAALADLPQEDQDKAIAEKKAEIYKQEYEALSEKAKKAEEIARNQEIRAKKAEALAKSPKADTTAQKNNFDLKDLRALQDVPDEDVDEVVEYAKFKGITIVEAKVNPVIKTLLKSRKEERDSAAAANTGTTKRLNKTDDNAVLEKLNKGEEMSDDEMTKAAQLRIQQKKAK